MVKKAWWRMEDPYLVEIMQITHGSPWRSTWKQLRAWALFIESSRFEDHIHHEVVPIHLDLQVGAEVFPQSKDVQLLWAAHCLANLCFWQPFLSGVFLLVELFGFLWLVQLLAIPDLGLQPSLLLGCPLRDMNVIGVALVKTYVFASIGEYICTSIYLYTID